jgi:hypothetical protein
MPVPSVATYTPASLVAAHTAWLALLDAETGAASVAIRSIYDVDLAIIPLTDPAGTINGTTGQITLTPDGREESAPSDGSAASGSKTAAYAEIRNGAGVSLLAMPCQAGESPVSGFCVINSLTITPGIPVEIISLTIG